MAELSTARPDRCRRCLSAIWTFQWMGLDFHTDTRPLDPAGELAARRAGRHTYTARPGWQGFTLHDRWTWDVARTRHDTVVVANHDCTDSADTYPDYWPKPPAPAADPDIEGTPF